MRSKKLLRVLIILAILTINIGCDQVSKTVVRETIDYNETISMVYDHLTLTKVENAGAFLSLGDALSGPMRLVLLNILPLLILGFGLYYILTKTSLPKVQLLAFILVLGGGLGNLYDRIMHDSVTDFVHINFVIFQTGVFNVADLSITTGIIILLFHTYFQRKTAAEVNTTS